MTETATPKKVIRSAPNLLGALLDRKFVVSTKEHNPTRGKLNWAAGVDHFSFPL
jgi:hypothetical protein